MADGRWCRWWWQWRRWRRWRRHRIHGPLNSLRIFIYSNFLLLLLLYLFFIFVFFFVNLFHQFGRWDEHKAQQFKHYISFGLPIDMTQVSVIKSTNKQLTPFGLCVRGFNDTKSDSLLNYSGFIFQCSWVSSLIFCLHRMWVCVCACVCVCDAHTVRVGQGAGDIVRQLINATVTKFSTIRFAMRGNCISSAHTWFGFCNVFFFLFWFCSYLLSHKAIDGGDGEKAQPVTSEKKK